MKCHEMRREKKKQKSEPLKKNQAIGDELSNRMFNLNLDGSGNPEQPNNVPVVTSTAGTSGQNSNRTSELEQPTSPTRETVQNSNIAQAASNSFTWIIDKINDKITNSEEEKSERFDIGGYHMYLHALFGGKVKGSEEWLSVYFYLMEGKNDKDLDGPFKYDLSISLVNQQPTGGKYLNMRTKKWASLTSLKPSKEGSKRGFHKFIKLSELKEDIDGNKKALVFNDKIVIEFSVNLPS